MTFWQANPAIFAVYAALAVGFLLGVLSFSKLLTIVFQKARHTAYSLIVGLSLGSILSMFYNPDTFAVYADWAKNGVNLPDILLGAALLAVGVICAYLLVRVERKKAREEKSDEAR